MMTTLARDGAARTARQVVSQYCCDANVQCSATAVLLTSEIVTNALIHGRGAVSLAVHSAWPTVRVEVGDDGPGHPRVIGGDDDAEGGRGMLIVATLATTWGVIDSALGKVVWFELDCRTPDTGRTSADV